MRVYRPYFQLLLLLVVVLFAAGIALFYSSTAAAGGVPTVNGLFYGDGDVDNYIYLAENPGRGKLYYYIVPNDTLYVAAVVDRAVNDNVFADTGDATDQLYLTSAGWAAAGAEHTFRALLESDRMDFRITCDDGAYTNQFHHGYLYDADGDADPNEADWLSGPGDGPPLGGDAPLNINFASSLQWNLNNFASHGEPSWDITLTTQGDPPRTTVDTYKTPGDGADDEDVTDEIGYPPTGPITFDTANGWEWPLVYEWGALLGVCNGTPVTVQVVHAHNSPSKDGETDLPFYVTDYGDLPDSYGTSDANDGARHLIELDGPYLGEQIDGENDGAPSANASGDNQAASNDEDGLEFDTVNTDWTTGTGELDAYITGGSSVTDACLDVWADFGDDGGSLVANGDGDFFDAVNGVDEWVIQNASVSSTDAQPINFLFALPVGIEEGSVLAVRARLSQRDDAGGCSGEGYAAGVSPIGGAIGGEVEDYIVDLGGPTNAGLSAFTGDGASLTGWLAMVAALLAIGLAGLLALRKLSLRRN